MVNFIAIFGTLAFCHALFLAVFFWRRQEGNTLSNQLLALLLLALAVRITKSVIGIVIPGTGKIAPVFGVAGMVLIGPFLWLYYKSLLDKWVSLPHRAYLHFVLPALFVAVFLFIDRRRTPFFYQSAVLHMTMYTTASIFLLWRELQQSVFEKNTRQWMWGLVASVSLILGTYYVQLIVDSSQTYILITATAAVILYLLSFWGMTRMRVFSKINVNRNAAINDNQAELASRIARFMEEGKAFTDRHLTVHSLAAQMDAPAYLISKVINSQFQKTFPEMLHDYRIAEASRQLLDPAFNHLSMEGIALESGFQSVSAFYKAFKKVKGVSPAEWRRQHLS
ncbi:MAG: helix-turn-helix domain-containing protein [Bacteroidetes bacterium]|nr:helix-turn-helix domain-containing protein [Bacteroidota bacterium]